MGSSCSPSLARGERAQLVESMRVLNVCFAYPPFLSMGGPPRKVQAISRRLAKRHAVFVLTANHEQERASIECWDEGVQVLYARTLFRYHNAITINPGVRAVAHRLVRVADVAHIYGIYDFLGPTAGRACRRAGVPYVVETLGMYRPRVRSIMKKRVYHTLLGRPMVQGASRLIVTSDLERQELIQAGLPVERIVLRRNGLDLSEFGSLPPRGNFRRSIGLPTDDFVALFFGRLTGLKRPEMLLDALKGPGAQRVRLVFAGPDEDGTRGRLEARAASLGLGERTHFVGPLYGRDKLQALVDADVFVLPSGGESFGTATIEAMACGLPVVVSDRCGVAPEVHGRAGLVVLATAESVCEALVRLESDAAFRLRLGTNGRKLAKHFSWDEPVAQMEALYEAIVAESGKRAS